MATNIDLHRLNEATEQFLFSDDESIKRMIRALPDEHGMDELSDKCRKHGKNFGKLLVEVIDEDLKRFKALSSGSLEHFTGGAELRSPFTYEP